MNNPFIDFITYEDIFIHEKRNFIQAIAHATGFTEDNYTGIEVDLDCIEAHCQVRQRQLVSVLCMQDNL